MRDRIRVPMKPTVMKNWENLELDATDCDKREVRRQKKGGEHLITANGVSASNLPRLLVADFETKFEGLRPP